MSRYKVTEGLRVAVNRWLEDKDLSIRAAANIVGCSHPTIKNIKEGLTDHVHSDTLKSLELYVNAYRPADDLQNHITEGIKKAGGYNPNLWKWNKNVIDSVKEYKDRKGLSYEEMSKKYSFPLLKLVKYMETEYDQDDYFEVSPEDVPALTTMLLQISSDNFNGR